MLTELRCLNCGCKDCSGDSCVPKVPIFSMLSGNEVLSVTGLITHRRFKKGQVIFYEGDVADKFYIINTGKLKIYKTTREGKDQILYILAEGDFIGDLNLLKKGRFQFNAEAIEDVVFCMITKDDFDQIIRKNPEISLGILENLHDRLIGLENLVQTLSTKDVGVRIAGLLVSLAESFGQNTVSNGGDHLGKGERTEKEGEVLLDLPLSREDLANFIGVTRETISRKLTSLQEEGIIELVGSRKIRIRELSALRSLSG